MKKNAIKILFLAVSFIIFGKSSQAQYPAKEQKDHIYKTYDQAPIPPGNLEGYLKYMPEHIQVPTLAVEAEAHGNVYISVTINKDGSQSNEYILKDYVGYGCAEQALQKMKSMHLPWKPALRKGKPVSIKYVISVVFLLNPKENWAYQGNPFGCDTLHEPIIVKTYTGGSGCIVNPPKR